MEIQLETLLPAVHAVSEALARASLQGGAAALLAWGACRLIRNLPSRLTTWIWRLVLVRFLVALVWSPWEVPLAEGSYVIVALDPSHASAGDWREIAWAILEASLVGAWVIGVLSGLAMLAGAAWSGRKLLEQVTECRHEKTLQTAREIAMQMGLRRTPALAVTLHSESPCLTGLLHPVVLLPNPWKFCESKLRLILAHEFTHLRRADLWWTWLSAVTTRVFFFHPLVWLADRELKLAQELTADQAAIAAAQGTASDLGELLIEMVEAAETREQPLAIALRSSGSFRSLLGRMEALHRYRPPGTERFLPLSVGLLLVMMSLGVVWTPIATSSPMVFAIQKSSRPGASEGPLVILSNPLGPNLAPGVFELPGSVPPVDLRVAADLKARLRLLEALGFCPDSVSLHPRATDGRIVWQLETQQRQPDLHLPAESLVAVSPPKR